MTTVEAKPKPTAHQKYEILDYTELPVKSVLRNMANPRPAFHLKEDDPELLALADSIRTEGQHRPILVYELIGHYDLEDRPGKFVLLQGERRWRACQIGGTEMIRANIARVPVNRAEELELLSVEDAHKLEWQPFFEMRHAAALAAEYGIPIRHPNIVAKTGLSMDHLRIAEKVFSLDEAIQDMVAAYEQEMYNQRVSGKRRKHSRINGEGSRTTGVTEFTPAKAALVYDLFGALRKNLTLTVKDFTDLELQQRISTWATNGANTEELSNLLQAIKQTGTDAPPGMIAKVHNMIQNPDVAVKSMVKTMGNSQLQRLNNASKRMVKIGRDADLLSRRGDNFGHDMDLLEQIKGQVAISIRGLERLERTLDERIRLLGRQ